MQVLQRAQKKENQNGRTNGMKDLRKTLTMYGHKKKCIIITTFLMLLLTGCSQNKKEDISVEKASLQTYDYQKVDSLGKDVKITEGRIAFPEHGQTGSFCVYGDTIYYVVGFSDYLANNTGEDLVEFEEKYNTQIRAFNMETKEDSLLYQYKEDKCIEVTDLVCNGTYLIWEDYKPDWRIQKLLLAEGGEPEVIFDKSVYESGTLWSVTPTITHDNLYWYDQNDSTQNPVTLFQYDFKTAKTEVFQSNLDLSSPHAHVSVVNDICTFFEKGNEDETVIYICDLEKGYQRTLTVPVEVSNPISDGEICVWLKGENYDDRKIMYVYDLSEGSFEEIRIPYVFSYGILGGYIVVNQRSDDFQGNNQLLCYDVKTKTYLTAASSEDMCYGYSLRGLSENIYMDQYKWNETMGNCLEVINLSV